MNTFDLRPTARLQATPVVGLLFLSFCATAFTQNATDFASRERPFVTGTPINLSPRTQLILDPTFEAGDPWPDWTTQTGTEFGTPLCDLATCGDGGGSAPPFAGSNWAWFGGFPAPQVETLGQVVTIPTGVTASLTFQMRIGAVSSPFTDTLTVQIDGTTLQTFTEPGTAEADYTLRTFNVSAFADGAPHTILFTYVGTTAGTANFTIDDVNLNTTNAPPLLLSSAVSRKTHGAAGTFNIPLPLSSPFGVECRTQGAGYTFVFTFSNSVVSGSASVTTGTGDVSGSPVFNGNTMTVNLTGVTDVQLITVTLSGVTDTFSHVLPSTPVSAKILVGDVVENSSVGAGDIGFVKEESSPGTVTADNFRADVAVNGSINASDIGIVKANSGHSLP